VTESVCCICTSRWECRSSSVISGLGVLLYFAFLDTCFKLEEYSWCCHSYVFFISIWSVDLHEDARVKVYTYTYIYIHTYIFILWSFYSLLSILCVLCFCIVLSIVSPYVYGCFFSICVWCTDHCHQVKTQLQLINISHHITSHHIISHISYHIISYHIISYHIISYRIIYHNIASPLWLLLNKRTSLFLSFVDCACEGVNCRSEWSGSRRDCLVSEWYGLFVQKLLLAQLVRKFLAFIEFDNLLPAVHQRYYPLSIANEISFDLRTLFS
jgi:hypothetical protein